MPLFKIDTNFSHEEAQAILDAISIIFDVPSSNVIRFLGGLPSGPFYITKFAGENAGYEGKKNLSSFNFYDVDVYGNLLIPSSPAGPVLGENISVGAVYAERAAAGLSIGKKASPTGILLTSLSRTLFHELAHAVTLRDRSNIAAFGPDNTDYAGVEALAIAAENLIYAKDRRLPSRIGHNPKLLNQSYDPALPFRNITDVYFDIHSEPKSGKVAVFSGRNNVDSGTVRKSYGHTGPVLNNVIVTGIKAQIVTDVGGLSQTFKDSLSGMLADEQRMRKDILSVVASVGRLSASGALLARTTSLTGATPSITEWGGFHLSSLGSVVGFSNERFTDGNFALAGKTVNYVGPVNRADGRPSLNMDAAVPQIVIGASGFYDSGKGIDLRAAGDQLKAADGGTNVLMAGSGQGAGVTHLLQGGTGDDVLIGGAGDDIVRADAGADLVVQSAGHDQVTGNAKTIFAVSNVDFHPLVDTHGAVPGQTTVMGADPASGSTILSGVHIILGGDRLTTFIGNALTPDVFVAGAGGGDFTLSSGDVAIGNPEAKKGNVYRVTTKDVVDGHVGIVGFGKNDRLYVDGILFNGSTVSGKITGQSWDSNADFAEGSGVLLTGSSSWGFKSPPPGLRKGVRDDGFRYNYWHFGSGEVKTATYVMSPDSVVGQEAGDIFFQAGQQASLDPLDFSNFGGGEPTPLNKFDISITGWRQGYGGINFYENNLARDLTSGYASITGVFAIGIQAESSTSYYSNWGSGGYVKVGSLFGSDSSEWAKNRNSGYSSGRSIADLIAVAIGGAPAGGPGGGSGGFGGGDGGGFDPGGLGGLGTASDVSPDSGETGVDGSPMILEGGEGADILDPQGIYPTVVGHGGGDTIHFGANYGILTLEESDGAASPDNHLVFAAPITPVQVIVSGTAEGDLVLSVSDTDKVILSGALRSVSGNIRGVQRVSFADGTSWSYADLLATVGRAANSVSTIFGDSSANVLDSLGISNAVVGGGGGDTLVFKPGYGAITVYEEERSTSSVNTLALGGDLDPRFADVFGKADGSILINFGYGDSVTLAGALLSTPDVARGVQQLALSDGTTWSYGDLLARADTASPFNTKIFGDRSANRLDGAGFATELTGGGGADVFVFTSGDRPITISEQNATSQEGARLELRGFSPEEVSVRGDMDGNLILSAAGADQVTILQALKGGGGTSFGVQQVIFDGGVTWAYSDLLMMASRAALGKTALYGDGAANAFDPLGLAAVVVGGGGGDSVFYQRGYGALLVVEVDPSPTPSNELKFGLGIAAADVMVLGNAYGDLVLDLGDGDIVTLARALASAPSSTNGVQTVAFADGTVWTYADLLGRALTPVAGTQSMYGDNAANVLDGRGIATTLVGNGGDDSFVYRVGYGLLTINERDEAGASNILAFGPGVDARSVEIAVEQRDSILLSIPGGGAVLLKGALSTDEATSVGVQVVSFADGTLWTYGDLLAMVKTASSQTTTIYGDGHADVLDPVGVATTVVGGGGGDTIFFEKGYGSIVLDERDKGSQPLNTLVFGEAFMPDAIAVVGTGSGDIVIDAGGGDRVTILNALRAADGLSFGVQEVAFADGTIWTYDDLLARADTPSTINTVLYGDALSNILDGKGIAHELTGNGGDDVFIFEAGYGPLLIDEHDQGAGGSVLKVGVGINPAAVSVTANALGDIILDMAGGDQVTIRGALNSDDETTRGVDWVEFADGTTWSYADLVSRADTGVSVTAALFGDRLSNRFDTLGLSRSVIGRGGGDIVIYKKGYGQLSIDEVDGDEHPSNILAFGAGITAAATSVSATAAGDIVLTVSAGDVITLIGAALPRSGAVRGVQEVTFEDGSRWDAGQLRALAGGSWIVADDGSRTVIDEAAIPVGSRPGIVLAFNAADSEIELGADRTSVTVTSVSGTSVEIKGLLIRGAGQQQSLSFSDGAIWTLAETVERASNADVIVNYRIGTEAAEEFSFSGGVQLASGRGGGDAFRYERGDGDVSIEQSDVTGSPGSVLYLGDGITLDEFVVTTDSTDLKIKLRGGGSILISEALHSDASVVRGVQCVQFSDGTSVTYAQLLAIADTGAPWNSGTLFGDAADNIIDPAGFSHRVLGGGGADTIVYGNGYGDLEIANLSYSPSQGGTIAFAAGISPDDIVVLPALASPEIWRGEMDVIVDGSTIKIRDEFYGSTPTISNLVFADGTILTYADILARMATPIPGAPAIGGDLGPNILDTRGLVHRAIGNGGGDTFVYGRGYGALEIEEYDSSPTPPNRVLFSAGIKPADVVVNLDYHGVYTLDLGGADQVTFRTSLLQYFNSVGISAVEFADGTSWSADDLFAMAHTGSPRRTVLQGMDLDEIFDSRGYANYIDGTGGNDAYLFKRGYGALTIVDSANYGRDTNTIKFGEGINPSDVVLSQAGDSLVLSIGASDRILVPNQFGQAARYGISAIQKVEFADGTVWTESQIEQRLSAAVEGVAAGFVEGSVIQGSVVLPIVTDGTLTASGDIKFSDADLGDLHQVSVVGVQSTDQSFAGWTFPSQALAYLSTTIVTDAVNGTEGLLHWTFNAPSSAFHGLAPGQKTNLVFTIQLRDGGNAVASQNVTVEVGTDLNGNPGTRRVNGTSGDDSFDLDDDFVVDPGAGNDSLVAMGYSGGGSIKFGTGYGADVLSDNYWYASRRDYLVLNDVDASQVSVSRDGSALAVTIDATGDTFTAANQFSVSNGGDYAGIGIYRIVFRNGDVWNRVELANRVNSAEVLLSGDGVYEAAWNSETFSVQEHAGEVAVDGFDPTSDRHDYISLNRSKFTNWEGVLAATTQQGGDLLITVDADTSLRLVGVALSAFNSADLKFTEVGHDNAPVIGVGADQGGHLDELPWQTGADTLGTVAGELDFMDSDLLDRHTAQVVGIMSSGTVAGLPTDSELVSALTLGSLTEPSNGSSGHVAWTFSAPDRFFDYLATGDTVTITFRIRIADQQGQAAVGPVTITVVGSNDGPLIAGGTTVEGALTEQVQTTSSTSLDSISGVVRFTDADVGDVHMATIASVSANGTISGLPPSAALLEMATIGSVVEPSGNTAGSLGWTFAAADQTFDYLAAGETVTLTFQVQISDGQSGTLAQPIAITITGTNDAPAIAAGNTATATAAEIAGTTGSIANDTASGVIRFVDLDLADLHTATIASVLTSGSTSGLPANATVLGWLGQGSLAEQSVARAASQSWSFSAPDSAFDYLGAGQTASLTYIVQVSDGKGGIVSQDVVLTITGTNDVPVVTTGTVASANLVEIASSAGSPNADADADAATGTIKFTDADAGDVHAISVTGVATTGVTSGLPASAALLGMVAFGTVTESTSSVPGSVGWTFSAADKNFDYLAAGQTVTLTYQAEVSDDHGGVSIQPLAVSISGTNDAPVISPGTTAVATVTQLPGAPGSATTNCAAGVIRFSDLDLSDVHSARVQAVTAIGNIDGLPSNEALLAWLGTGALSEQDAAGPGTVPWSFAAPDGSLAYLGVGESVTLTYRVEVVDAGEAIAEQDIAVTINGPEASPESVQLLSPISSPILGKFGSTVFLGGGAYRLTPDEDHRAGNIWGRVDLSADVIWTTRMYFGPDNSGADGLAFALGSQPRSPQDDGGHSLGVLNADTFGLKFDTYQNESQGDPDSDFTQFVLNGNVDASSHLFDPSRVLPNLENGQWHDVVIAWDATKRELSYSLDGQLVGSKQYDVVSNILGGSKVGYFAFGAATGEHANEQKVEVLSVTAGGGTRSVEVGAPGGALVGMLNHVGGNGADQGLFLITDQQGAPIQDPWFTIVNGRELRVRPGFTIPAAEHAHVLYVSLSEESAFSSLSY